MTKLLYQASGCATDPGDRKAVEQLLAQVETYIEALRAEGPTPPDAYEKWRDLKLFMSPFMLRGLCRAWLEAAE